MTTCQRQGPLVGLSVLEFAGMGPGPFCAMMLSDMGAHVLSVRRAERPGASYTQTGGAAHARPLLRGREVITLNLKDARDQATALALASKADVLLEGFRPGVMEKLGLGPDPCLAANPALIYARMTGYGQHGPLARSAGHDINYLSMAGALSTLGTEDAPVVPLNLVADFGGGGMFLLAGILAALFERQHSGQGQGQVVDAAMTDGVAALMAGTLGLHAAGKWQWRRNSNILDGGAPHYGVYRCADGEWLAVGSLEADFLRTVLDTLGIRDWPEGAQDERARWPALKQKLAAVFATQSRAEWMRRFADADHCVTPVLSMDEALHHPHNTARKTYVVIDGVPQPAPAPRFSRTPSKIQSPPADAPDAATQAATIARWFLKGNQRL